MTVLLIDGVDRTCDAETVTVTVGRTGVKEAGQPGYMRTDVESDQSAAIVTARVAASITVDGSSRHIGAVTDTALTHPTDGVAAQPVTSIGPLARWGLVLIGDEPWPAETVKARAERIATLIGQPIVVQGGTEQTVIPLDVDRRPAAELLTELANSTGGFLFDHAGVIYLQALDHRRVTVQTATWNDEPPGETWAQLDGTTWADDDAPGAMSPIVLDCSEVQAEPVWEQTAEVSTVVTVLYGPPDEQNFKAYVSVTDGAAADDYGEVELPLDSQLADETDALTLAYTVLQRSARPQWRLQSVILPWDALRPDTAARLAAALPGTRVTVVGLPQPAPAAVFYGVLEGWTETVTGYDRVFTLHLSDVKHSLAVPTWDAEPAGETWDQLDPALTWEDDL